MAEKKNEPRRGEQIADNRQKSGPALEEDQPVRKVTGQESGAKRGSYFKTRDYE